MTAGKTHTEIVEEQFGPQAAAYLSSATHAEGEDLGRLAVLLQKHPEAELLDLGCGGGHVSYTAAAHVRQVTAYDMSPQMLGVVASAAREKGFANIRTQQGVAEHLPFADASFDLVVSRYSAHHWHDVGRAVREAARVLKPGGQFVLMDVAAPGPALLDIYLQTVEMLRDTSHVRDYAPGEWAAFVGEAGLRLEEQVSMRLHLEYTPWIKRMRTPEVLAHAIREIQQTASQEVRSYFAIETDGSFSVDTLMLRATKSPRSCLLETAPKPGESR